MQFLKGSLDSKRKPWAAVLLWLTLGQILRPATAANCFADTDAVLLPQLMNYKLYESGYNEEYHAIDGTDSFIIYGGTTT